jgi:ribosomal-protein-alanine N-acetyltransferase
MKIVKMTADHVSQVAELEKICFSDPWSENSIASELDNKLSLWLVAVEDGKVVGYVGSQTVLGWADMMNIAVHPDYRRRGIAESLVEKLLSVSVCRFCLRCAALLPELPE